MLNDLKEILLSANQSIIDSRAEQNKIYEELGENGTGITGEKARRYKEKEKYRRGIRSLLFKSKKAESQVKYDEIIEEENALLDEINRLSAVIDKNCAILGKLAVIPEEQMDDMKRIHDAKSLQDLNMSFNEIKRVFQEAGKEMVLDESDNNKAALREGERPTNYALVHLTDYLPENGEIKRMVDKGVKKVLEGSWGKIEFDSTRETTHLAVGSEVADTNLTSWDDKKIAVIIPLKALPVGLNITSYNPSDFQVKGSVKAEEGCIVCPLNMVEEAREKNPDFMVIPYRGENVRGLGNQALQLLGFNYAVVSDHGFVEKIHNATYEKALKEHFGIDNLSMEQHVNSDEKIQESTGFFNNVLEAFKEGIENGTVNYSSHEKEIEALIMSNLNLVVTEKKKQILSQLLEQGQEMPRGELDDLIRQNVNAQLKRSEENHKKNRVNENLMTTYGDCKTTVEDVREASQIIQRSLNEKDKSPEKGEGEKSE